MIVGEEEKGGGREKFLYVKAYLTSLFEAAKKIKRTFSTAPNPVNQIPILVL